MQRSQLLEGHYRKYIGFLGRTCGWKETSTFCKKCHACFDGHEWLEGIEAYEKVARVRCIPFSTVFPGYSRWTILRVLWRDKRRCRGCRSKLGIRFHRRAKKPAHWNLWGRFRQWKNVYLLCETCLRRLEAKRGRVQPG